MGGVTLQKLLLWVIASGYEDNICNIKRDGVNKCKARGVRKKCEKGAVSQRNEKKVTKEK